MIYHLRYWWHVALRKLRIVRVHKDCITLQEMIADYERDPEMRQLLAEARKELRRVRTT